LGTTGYSRDIFISTLVRLLNRERNLRRNVKSQAKGELDYNLDRTESWASRGIKRDTEYSSITCSWKLPTIGHPTGENNGPFFSRKRNGAP
jgi:hypothetical protein